RPAKPESQGCLPEASAQRTTRSARLRRNGQLNALRAKPRTLRPLPSRRRPRRRRPHARKPPKDPSGPAGHLPIRKRTGGKGAFLPTQWGGGPRSGGGVGRRRNLSSLLGAEGGPAPRSAAQVL